MAHPEGFAADPYEGRIVRKGCVRAGKTTTNTHSSLNPSLLALPVGGGEPGYSQIDLGHLALGVARP